MTKQELIAFENSIRELWRAGKIRCPHHFCGGNEEQLISYFEKHVRPWDWVFSTHRNAYHWLLKTGDAEFLVKQILSGNSMHVIDVRRRFISTAIVGGGCGPAVGVARAIREANSNEHVHCFVGDGATDQGWFWEAIRYATAQDLNITFVIEDNDRSVCSSKRDRWGAISDGADNPHVFYYRYTPVFPHVGDGRPIEW